MKTKKEEANKLKINKGQLAVRIMSGILVILMLVSVFGTCAYYLISYFSD